jgi:NAD(P)-dependent dehydrogenase (short-subunit alcohol dehydrogenase family)
MTDDTIIALVTGANKGIGLEIVAQLAERGMTVLLGARDAVRREEAVVRLAERGLTALPVALDVTDPASASAAAAYVGSRFGRLDVLVNNAGITGGDGQWPGAADLAVVRRVFDVNFFGALTVTEAMLPLLRRSRAGRIVNMSSSLASLGLMTTPDPRLTNRRPALAYRPAKAALNSLTVQYATELRGSGILVNAADPGLCATDMAAGRQVTRTAAQGAAVAVRLATLPGDGPTGGYFNEDGPLPW